MTDISTPKRQAPNSISYFNPIWEVAYLCAEHEGSAKCLVCLKSLNQLKKYNLQRHYNSFHAKEYARLTGEERLTEIKRLKSKLIKLQEIFEEEDDNITPNEAAVRASYRIALETAKSSRCFQKENFVKHCLLAAAEQVCPEQVNKFECIGLSQTIITHRIHEMANDVTEQLSSIVRKFIAYSLIMDENIDTPGSPQLSIFIRGVDENLSLTEELLDIFSIKEYTSGEDVFSWIEEIVEQNNLQWDNLVSIAAGGASTMADKTFGFENCLYTKLDSLTVPHEVTTIHYSIYPENLCSKSVQLDSVISLIVTTMNYIRSYGATRSEFKTLLEELDVEFGELPYPMEMHWFSRGKMLNKFFEQREEIRKFIDMAGQSVPELQDEQWISDLAFLSDIIDHLNVLHLALQEKGNTIIDFFDTVCAFKMKLELWMRQLGTGKVCHFIKLQEVAVESNFERYIDVLKNLQNEFESRFQDVARLENNFDIIATPFSVDINVVPSHFQLELIELKYDRILKEKFEQRRNLLEFYNNFNQCRFPRLYKCAATIIAMFGTTYLCEKLYSVLKRIKSTGRTKISSHELKSIIILSTSQTVVPNITELVEESNSRMPTKESFI
ncbi:general transcription factor II-I repeat domain-containing protein 2-like [Colletes gigas]|uniref:general transcription factor II-I repeat domain-containing protein 2-like n=1 Tax=Colletes gigas TaxID=935657 RepID=UPI001C9B1F66|nr:general transcription factor II-I repeat domain-containing protein 2-like [Colletes gigas]